MRAHLTNQSSETQRKRLLERRMLFVHGFFAIWALVIAARLIELQLLRGDDFHAQAQSQHFEGIVLPARRGEILSVNSKTGELNILATNTTLDLLYVDPFVTDEPSYVAGVLADNLVTDTVHQTCSAGLPDCPRELLEYYAAAYDPMRVIDDLGTGAILEPVAPGEAPPIDPATIPSIESVRQQFKANIENRITEKRVRFVPLLYGANKKQMAAVDELSIPGVTVVHDSKLIYADPEVVTQTRTSFYARQLADVLDIDPAQLERLLSSKTLRYVPIMRQLPPTMSQTIQDLKEQADAEAIAAKRDAPTREAAERIRSRLRGVALIPEHWRYYPDSTVGSHVVGFLNALQEPQYGIERTYNPQLRGKEGKISAVSDPTGGQILTSQQTIVDAQDGDTVVLTIDRHIQKFVEQLLDDAVKRFDADSGQVIVMEPKTGRILAMVNAPLFDANEYGSVYDKAPMYLTPTKQKEVVVELYHPETNEFIVRSFFDGIFTASGRTVLQPETLKKVESIEELYDLEDIARYYIYIGENSRREIFPTDRPDVWLKYDNNIGVGAYLNRNIQEIYEPGSVMKAISMAIAIDQGEVTPTDRYQDDGPIKVDEFTIRNALNAYYGDVTMVNCLEFSINTCMTSVSGKLGRKLYYRMLEQFGFGRITGIELEDELPGEILPWRKWSSALLATSAYGQGVSATPLQVITAFSALANDGKLMRPTIVDRVITSDGELKKTDPYMVDQVIKPESAETITAMLVSTVTNGYARTAKVPGYRIAGKTGTSQIAGPGGRYESGTGSNITSFAGFAPVDDPKFTILVKFDRPRNIDYGSESGAPIFKEIASFLFTYYGIPPDEE